MVTIYDLLEVEEDASKDEIEKAYSRLVLEFRQDIKFSDETNKENEMIVNKLKLAYEILTDDDKRKKYDYQLAQKRAENLIENISSSNEPSNNSNNVTSEVYENQISHTSKENTYDSDKINVKIQKQDIEQEILTNDEKQKITGAS